MDKKQLREFSEEVKKRFENAEIKAPIHLSGNNEEQLIKIFTDIKRTDWVCSTHRSHYHALLHGIDKDWLMNEILKGRSITIMNRKKQFITSAIVAGILPIALGIALGLKRKKSSKHVWAFVGDMASRGGVFHEVVKYASGHQLPLSIIVEDNNYSTNTPTNIVWGDEKEESITVIKYSYERIYPHQGSGRWVEF
ncbi:hypothetical protein LCGC14_1955070 [marine sediment metagenome]|uniref:Dehydrogenase E1 component domain-containing protein n=1 Tax=marine sediment metagenome TaxID=412755 RepID=A0A0F9IDF9_9ZZZZ